VFRVPVIAHEPWPWRQHAIRWPAAPSLEGGSAFLQSGSTKGTDQRKSIRHSRYRPPRCRLGRTFSARPGSEPIAISAPYAMALVG